MQYSLWHGSQENGHRFIWVGHRGAASLAPANTLASFQRALDLGVDLVEVDLRRTHDGVLVLAHDDTLGDAQGRRLAVADETLEALRQVDLGGGERLPTFIDAIRQVRGRAGLMVDLKGEGFEQQLVDELRAERLEYLVVPGGTAYSRRRLREIEPGLPLSLSLGMEPRDAVTPLEVIAEETEACTLQHRLVTCELVEALHAVGKVVFAWTVDDAARMEELLRMGVDGLISNRPQLFAQVSATAQGHLGGI